MLFTSRIKELETQLADVTTQRDALAATGIKLSAERDALQAEVTGIQPQLVTAQATINQLNADLDTARASLASQAAASQAAIQTEVVNRLGAAGIAPINRAPIDPAKAMSRDEFSKLSPNAQAAFCRKGGKLSD